MGDGDKRCETCGHNIERGYDFICERGDNLPCEWAQQSAAHKALRARVAELEAEVERLRGVVVESDKDLVANAARRIARDHNMPLKSAEWMMLEALRVVRSNDNRERDAALARAEAAEAREAGLRSALEYIRELKRQFDDCALRVEELDAVIEIDETAANALAAAPAKDGGK